MSEFRKFSKWISEMERQLEDMKTARVSTEARIAKKINRLVLDAVGGDRLVPKEKMRLYNRLTRMARCLESEDTNMSTLQQVEHEVDSLYANSGVKEELEALTTYDPEESYKSNKESPMPKEDFEVVRKEIESSWSDF